MGDKLSPIFAGVAQSVVQLIRNQQVVCSSHITSSIQNNPVYDLSYIGFFVLTDVKLMSKQVFSSIMIHYFLIFVNKNTADVSKMSAVFFLLFAI